MKLNLHHLGLQFDIKATHSGIELSVRGYNAKLDVLLRKVLEEFADLHSDAAQFELVRESVEQALVGSFSQRPYQLALHRQDAALTPTWTRPARLQAVRDVTLDQVLKFAGFMRGRGRWHVLVHGNADENDALSLSSMFTSLVPMTPLGQHSSRGIMLPPGRDAMFAEDVHNPAEGNSAALVYYQIGRDDWKTRARLRLLADIAKQPFYDLVRTVKQLGYAVDSK
jgi:insulysin